MNTDDATSPQDGDSDRPIAIPNYMARVRAVAQRILERVKKATEDTEADSTSLPPSEAPTTLPSDPPTAEQPPLTPPPV